MSNEIFHELKQIFWGVGAVRPTKSPNLRCNYLIRYIHDFFCESSLYYGDCENNKSYGGKARSDHAQIQSRNRVEITLHLLHMIFA